MTAPATMTVLIPLVVRQRNGRPKIMPPAEVAPSSDGGVDPHVLRAIGRAWCWRRRLETGEASTIFDIAQAEDVTDRYVSRMIRLAYLAPTVLEKLVLERCPPAVSIKDLAVVADLPWAEQHATAFGGT
jgi:hypothetical protein